MSCIGPKKAFASDTVRRRKSPWQFSLLGLFLLMTLVAVTLGIFSYSLALGIGLSIALVGTVGLLAADQLTDVASPAALIVLTRIAWAIVILAFAMLVTLIVYANVVLFSK
jgi:hypothetical protein